MLDPFGVCGFRLDEEQEFGEGAFDVGLPESVPGGVEEVCGDYFLSHSGLGGFWEQGAFFHDECGDIPDDEEAGCFR